jgi:CheY-like chemotaxis protein/anti-sigma regulatory factor (Ser/Thr protein kinase)
VSSMVLGKMEIAPGTTRVDLALLDALNAAQPAADTRRVELVREFEAEAWTATGDGERLQQIFGNVLSNAVKFTPRGGRVTVRASRTPDELWISVTDNGEGIEAELLPHIFDRFRQADSASGRRHGGVGLGLAIARSLVKLHGGTLVAGSAGAGLGAVFTVRLPLLASERQLPDSAPAMPLQPAGHLLHGVRILVVEDNADAAFMVAQALQFEGAVTEIALAPSQALEIAARWQPDVLLLDIGLPEMDGGRLLPLLRARLGAEAADLPAIALTGFCRPADVTRAAAAGFQAHVVKPFDTVELCRLIARLPRSDQRNAQNAQRPEAKPS